MNDYTKNQAKSQKNHKLTKDQKDFLIGYHKFFNMFPTSKVASILGVSKQNAYDLAKRHKENK